MCLIMNRDLEAKLLAEIYVEERNKEGCDIEMSLHCKRMNVAVLRGLDPHHLPREWPYYPSNFEK
jgi:hypothetical protein